LEKGLVIKSTGSWYTVKNGPDIIKCKIKGKFRIKDITTTNPVTVGDIVNYKIISKNNIGIITNIRERKNYIIRRASNLSREAHLIASNVDQAFLMFTINYPETQLEFIDRFLVTSEAYHIPTVLIINKTDLYDTSTLEKMKSIKEIYLKAGYQCYETSVTKNINVDLIKDLMKNKINVICGNSGVGKSALINAIDKNLNLKVEEISSYHKKGKHTTSFSEMFELEHGGYIIDTPGIKGFGLIDFKENEISLFFPEIFKTSKDCQYYNCSHTHEPKCAVKEAVEHGEISTSRYKSYVNILNKDENKYRMQH
jgi:ribosome biogenesis GTPase